ncbi:MAG: hypothetical protein ACK5Y2_07135 [Bdellovibrionales bacterium]
MISTRTRPGYQLGLCFLGFLLSFLTLGCATYQDRVSKARQSIASGQLEEALKDLKQKADAKSDDQLVYLLDYATALQIAGRTDESIRYFLWADKLADELDYHSVARITGSMLLNEEMVQYKGDTFEKVFINAFLALNFLQKNDFDGAMVEVRRMNEKFSKYRIDEKKSFEVNPFSRYLAAMIYEANDKWDDAYIAYRETYKLDASIPRLRQDLVRSSYYARRMDDHKSWRSQFPDIEFTPQTKSQQRTGDLTVIYLQGWGPRKYPDPAAPLFPILQPVMNQTQKAQVVVNGEPKSTTELVYDTGNAAIATLLEDRPALVARRIAARVAREAAAREIGKSDNKGAGATAALAFIAMQVTERADLRQWSFLPASIQVAQVSLPAGEYDISLLGLNSSLAPSGERSEPQKIKIKPGQSQFLIWRSVK